MVGVEAMSEAEVEAAIVSKYLFFVFYFMIVTVKHFYLL